MKGENRQMRWGEWKYVSREGDAEAVVIVVGST